MRPVTLATCTLNQWAMDFEGNYQKILESILVARERGATYRCGPELEVTGYGCADHFYESDTFLHSWEVVAKIMEDERCSNILIDVGMPVMHKNVAYNCRVIILNKNILLIRPKKKLCDSGIYRESRWFTGWMKMYQTDSFILPKIIQNVNGQTCVPIGDAVIRTSDTCIGYEICEELWNPDSELMKQCLSGTEITVNSSGGFHLIGGTKDVINVIKSTTSKYGGIYLFSNLRGCDGDLMYYHGTSHITMNGNISAIGEQFSLKDVEVVTTTLDLDEVSTYRKNICRLVPEIIYEEILIDFCVSSYSIDKNTSCNVTNTIIYEDGEEVALGPACWLWDYLRKGNFKGFLLPLDGGIDSSSSAIIVYSMCNLVCKAINEGNTAVLCDLRKIINDSEYLPKNPKELCNKILVTCNIHTEGLVNNKVINSKELAAEIGCKHVNIPVQSIILSIINMLSVICVKVFSIEINSKQVEQILQSNIERINMIFLYILADILSLNNCCHNRLLVLGSGNAEKALLGYYTKHGFFSGDINLTGAISHKNLKQFLKYSQNHFGFTSLERIILSTDEINIPKIGTPEEVELLCKLRKNYCGPYSSFTELVSRCDKNKVKEISRKVKQFFNIYSLYHHKSFSIAPCLHVDSYATVNCYYNQRPFLYNSNWSWQFRAIDQEIKLH